jgi:hypothetical protein
MILLLKRGCENSLFFLAFCQKELEIFRFHAEFFDKFWRGSLKYVENTGNVPGIVPVKMVKNQ